MKNETTETFLRWLEAQDPITKSFHLPKPEEAGFLAAVRLRHTHYRKREVGARHPLAKTCEKNGWLEVREVKDGHLLKLTDVGRAALDAVLEINWRMKT